MNPSNGHTSEVRMVGLILVGHEEKEEPVRELDALQDVDAHVEEDAVQDRKRDVAEHRGQQDGDPDHDEGQSPG